MSELENESVYPVVTLAGSMRFFDKMLEWAETFSAQGVIVLLPWKDKKEHLSDWEKVRYDMMQRHRIDMSETLWVININGYIGKSTEAEIAYAKSKGKEIRYVEDTKPKIVTLVGSGRFRNEFKEIEADLASKGYVVFQPSIFTVTEFKELTEEDHKILDMIHRQKMEMSTAVVVVNKDGYVGNDTQEEIDWARERGLNVFYWYHTEKGDQFHA